MQLQIKLQKTAQTTNKVPPNIYRGLEVTEKVRLIVCTANGSMKRKCYVFGGYKETNDLCLMYLSCNLRQVQYSRCIFKLKWEKAVERTYL